MNLYLLQRADHVELEFDEYRSAIVAAPTEDAARRIHPGVGDDPELHLDFDSWVPYEDTKATLIGVALEGTPEGVVEACFYHS